MSDFKLKKKQKPFDLLASQSKHKKQKQKNKAGVLHCTLKPPYPLLPPNEEVSCSSSRCLSGLDRIYFAPESQQLDVNSPQQLPGATLSSCPERLPWKPQINAIAARLQCCPLLYIQSNLSVFTTGLSHRW